MFIYLFCVWGGDGYKHAPVTAHMWWAEAALDGAGVFLLPVRVLQELNASLQAFTVSVTTYGPTLPGPLE